MEHKFLNRALSSEGHYCVVGIKPDSKITQKFYENFTDVISSASKLDKDGYNVYYGLATFKEAGSRKVDNIKSLQSFFLDLDCGPTKDFVDKSAAIKALKRFCMAHKLPRPTMIDSGRGVHAYWFLKESICYDVWLPVAERLKQLCAESNFPADPAVTADGARILRIPNTHNYKTDPPTQVQLFGVDENFTPVEFSVFSNRLGSNIIGMPVTTRYTPQELSNTMQNLMGNQESIFKDILIKTRSGSGCVQLAYIINNQDTMSEPMWRAGLSIAKFCSDSEKAIHKISHKHPDYILHDATQKTDLIKGPYTCVKFDEFRPDVCTQCPNWGKIKSPITLGRKLREAEIDVEGNYVEEEIVEAAALTLPNTPLSKYTIPKYPSPYVRGANGGVYIKTRNDDGELEEECIYQNDLYVVKRVRDAELGEAAVMRLHLPMDGVREFTIPVSVITSKEEFRKAVSVEGVAITKMDKLMTYTTHWVNELQTVQKAAEAYRNFGWTNDKLEAFILGNQKITADAIEFNPPSNATLGMFPSFEPKGTMEKWRETINFWNGDKFVVQQFALGMGFGTALMELMNINCGTVSFYHKESGTGKSALQWAQVGIWGDPESLILGVDDTQNFRMNRSEVYHSLPVAIDEVTNMSPYHLSELVYQNTSGQQKGRMSSSSNIERKRTGNRWSLLCSITSNTSIVERISMAKAMPKAEAQRVLECRVERIFDEFKDKGTTDAFEAGIKGNYGHAGPAFVQYVMKNLDACRKLLDDVHKRVDTRGELTAENRFWSATIAATITGLILSKRAGLHDYDVKKVLDWSIDDLLVQNKKSSIDMHGSVFETMNDFFAENISYILQIKSTMDNRAQQGNGLDQLVIPEQIARGKLIARYETDTKLFYLKPKPLKQWCGELQINYAHLVNEIMEHCEGKYKKVRLTKGTNLQLPPSNVIVMKFDIKADENDEEHT